MRLPNVQDLENADVAIVGAPFDTGASFRAGARFGPEGIRSVSHLLRPYNPSQDVSIFEHLSVIDYGDVPVVPGFIEESYERMAVGLEDVRRACLPRTPRSWPAERLPRAAGRCDIWSSVERVTGIEPAWSAWKAGAL